jgi:hypothetical protein
MASFTLMKTNDREKGARSSGSESCKSQPDGASLCRQRLYRAHPRYGQRNEGHPAAMNAGAR